MAANDDFADRELGEMTSPFRDHFDRRRDAVSDEEDTFDYRELAAVSSPLQEVPGEDEDAEEEDLFTYPSETAPRPSSSQLPTPVPQAAATTETRQPPKMNIEFEKLYGAALSGDIDLLMRLFRSSHVDAFTVANEASSRTGLTLLHYAASKGHLDVVSWLATDCGAMVDMEDKEGETALHKAALNGHLNVIKFLLTMPTGPADVHAQDADGWTPLHNAASKGYLDIVRYLCEQGGANSPAAPPVTMEKGVDRRSKGGWTALMNAASKGHLPVVLYLLQKANADPLVRNKWGETAYDAAVSVFEIHIASLLQKAEQAAWRERSGHEEGYNELAVHITVGVTLFENQRLVRQQAMISGVSAMVLGSGIRERQGREGKWTTSGLGRRGVGAFELRMPVGSAIGSNASSGGRPGHVEAWRSDVELPSRRAPFVMPLPRHRTPGQQQQSQTGSTASGGGEERSHFWLSDWTLDLSYPKVDAENGWQYASSFGEAEENWTASFIAPSSSTTASTSSDPGTQTQGTKVRRRRWVRLLRRRLDIPPLPFMEPNGHLYTLSPSGTLVPYTSDSIAAPQDNEFDGGAELASVPLSSTSSYSRRGEDYVSRAKWIAGEPSPASDGANALRRSIAKMERAVSELRVGMLSDDDADRKSKAEYLLNVYSRELEKQRLSAGAQGIYLHDLDDELSDEDDDSEFHYPVSPRTPSARRLSSHSGDYFSRGPSEAGPSSDLTPQLAQSVEFRVPTHEAPQKVSTPRWRPPAPHELHARWQRDEEVTECNNCRRRFTFLFRKHCRKCGQIFCDKCSSFRAVLEPTDVVHDPALQSDGAASASALRVCETCFAQVNSRVSGRLNTTVPPALSLESLVLDASRLSAPRNRSLDNLSQISDLADCPVCGLTLADLNGAAEQEAHVKNCLEGGEASDAQSGRYLVYKLPQESPLVGTECVICLEEFWKGSQVARLSCWCTFHNECLSAWLRRGRSCPVHAR